MPSIDREEDQMVMLLNNQAIDAAMLLYNKWFLKTS
jgi:hypothetical protein